MIYSSPREPFEVPALDLLTFLFESSHSQSEEDTVIHCEAAEPSIAITKAQARDSTKSIAYSLRHKFGIGANGPGKDVVVCISSGNALLPIAFYGIVAAGGVYSAASSSFTAAELARQIKQGSCNLLFCSEDVQDVAKQAAKACEIPLERVLVIRSGIARSVTPIEGTENHLDSEGKLDWQRITDRVELENSLVCLLYSSGTTGIPKGVLVSHENLVAECFIPSELWREHLGRRKEREEPPFEYRTLAHLPAAHIAGVQGYLINPLYMGGTVFWMPKFDFGKFLEYNKLFQITFFFSVPPIFLLIAKMPIVTDQFDSLEFAVSGAAPLGKETQHAASAKLGKGKVFISQTWGLSETTGSFTAMPLDKSDSTGSVSEILPNMEARIVGDNGMDVEEGQPGEILVKGPVVTKGYHDTPEASAAAFKYGWFCTGDIAIWRNGLLYIVDRKKELIKYKGLQVAPAELEALLLIHPSISDAAVIGVDLLDTEVPRAYVVSKKDVSEQDIKEFVKARVSDYKQLRGGVVFIAAIPKSASGKILRKDLRDLAKRELMAKL